jgi:hypothetical protein
VYLYERIMPNGYNRFYCLEVGKFQDSLNLDSFIFFSLVATKAIKF